MQNENYLSFNKSLVNIKENKIRHLLRYLGPAFVVSVAYIDPGNFATNIEGGSKFGYTLLWVILWSNIIAIFLQSISAKLGIATGKSLSEMCAEVFPRRLNWLFWVAAEFGAMAADLAEFIGSTLGLYLLFRMPIIYAGLITGVITYMICFTEKYGQRIVEIIISILIAVISISYLLELFLSKPDWTQVGIHTLIPMFTSKDAVFITAGILGATVMPHVIYLHSELVKYRNVNHSDEGRLNHLHMEKIDIALAMNMAFVINAAMLIVSAAVFYKNGIAVNTIEQADKSLTPFAGQLSSSIFGIALLASGLSSSAVGTLSGQAVMKGFVNLDIPVNARRLITMVPALIIIMIGVNPMDILVLSQVALSFILPFPIIQLLIITGRKDIMGIFVNKHIVKLLGILIAGIIITLNIILLCLTFA